jgi:hypothetical protein
MELVSSSMVTRCVFCVFPVNYKVNRNEFGLIVGCWKFVSEFNGVISLEYGGLWRVLWRFYSEVGF